MKRALFILIPVAMLCLWACSKKKDDITNTQNAGATGYVVSGVADIAMRNDTATQKLSVAWQSGTQERIVLSVMGLPPGIVTSITPDSGTGSFNSVVTYLALNVMPGIYSGKVIATSQSGGVKEYPFNINYSDCIKPILGNYLGFDSCYNNQDNIYSMSITRDTAIGKIWITNFPISGYSSSQAIYANIECGSNSFTIPQQYNSYGYIFSGSGTINNDSTITINYTVTNGASPSSCTVTMINMNKINKDCASKLIGYYNLTQQCGNQGYPNTNSSNIATDPTKPHRIKISNFYNYDNVYADVDCSTNTITVPAQTLGGYATITGTGSISSDNMVLTFTISYDYNGSKSTCTITMIKH